MEKFKVIYPSAKFVPTDLYPLQYGGQQCESGYSFGPCVRNNFLVHFVYEGEGVFINEYGEHHVGKGELFIICPNQVAYYRADTENPWTYRWIEFNGTLARLLCESRGMNEKTPVLNVNTNAGEVLKKLVKVGDMSYECVMSALWEFMSELPECQAARTKSFSEEYVEQAELFIKSSIQSRITVTDLADNAGINRSHLTRLFKKYRGMSPQEYIQSCKMNAAAEYLKNTNASISETARSVGYSDERVFSKAFVRYFGIAPSGWRKQEQWKQLIKSADDF